MLLPASPGSNKEVSRVVLLRRLSLRLSAYLCVLCVYGYFNAEVAEVRREPQTIEIVLKCQFALKQRTKEP